MPKIRSRRSIVCALVLAGDKLDALVLVLLELALHLVVDGLLVVRKLAEIAVDGLDTLSTINIFFKQRIIK